MCQISRDANRKYPQRYKIFPLTYLTKKLLNQGSIFYKISMALFFIDWYKTNKLDTTYIISMNMLSIYNYVFLRHRFISYYSVCKSIKVFIEKSIFYI